MEGKRRSGGEQTRHGKGGESSERDDGKGGE